MKIGILSDTHDKLDRTRIAVETLAGAGAECLVHCGDFTGPEIVAACAVLRPFYFVFGNNDSDTVPDLTSAATELGATCLQWGGIFEAGGKTIGVVHGHLTSDLRPIVASEPDYVLSGHSHATHDFRDGAIRRINPGALHRATEYTVAVLDVETDELQFLEIER